MIKAAIVGVLMAAAATWALSGRAGRREELQQLAEARTVLESRRPVSPSILSAESADQVHAVLRGEGSARGLALDLFEADSDECWQWIGDVDGDGRPDLLLKRYWTGSGAAFELLLCLDRPDGVIRYTFTGSERGRANVSMSDHVRDRRIIVPLCLVDRGADTKLNWSTTYALRNRIYEVSDPEPPAEIARRMVRR